MWRNKESYWSIKSDAARRRRARKAAEERAAEERAAEERLAPRPVKWEYHAPNDYRDVVYPPETEWGRPVLPQGRTYYFDTQAERDAFIQQHIAKIKPVWEAAEARWEAAEARWEAEEAERQARWEAAEAEKRIRIQMEKEAYDAETAQLCCLPRKLRNIRDWWAGTHTWRGVRL